MITQNNLYDLEFIFILIRHNIENINNIKVIDTIINLINNSTALTNENVFRQAISQTLILENEWTLINHNKYYTKTILCKNINILNLIKSLNDLRLLLNEHNFMQAYDLVDILQAVVGLWAKNKIINTKFKKTYFKPYNKKWNTKIDL